MTIRYLGIYQFNPKTKFEHVGPIGDDVATVKEVIDEAYEHLNFLKPSERRECLPLAIISIDEDGHVETEYNQKRFRFALNEIEEEKEAERRDEMSPAERREEDYVNHKENERDADI